MVEITGGSHPHNGASFDLMRHVQGRLSIRISLLSWHAPRDEANLDFLQLAARCMSCRALQYLQYPNHSALVIG